MVEPVTLTAPKEYRPPEWTVCYIQRLFGSTTVCTEGYDSRDEALSGAQRIEADKTHGWNSVIRIEGPDGDVDIVDVVASLQRDQS